MTYKLSAGEDFDIVTLSGGVARVTDGATGESAEVATVTEMATLSDSLSGKLGPYPFVEPAFTQTGNWIVTPPSDGYDLVPVYEDAYGHWRIYVYPTGSDDACDASGESLETSPDASSLTFDGYTATRGYVCTLAPFANSQIDMGWKYDGLYSVSVVSPPAYRNGAWTCEVAFGSMVEPITAEETDADASSLTFLGVDDSLILTAARPPTTFTVSVSASPVTDTMRDLWFVVEAGSTAPSITWDSAIDRFPGGAASNAAPDANATTVYHIFEYENGKLGVEKQGEGGTPVPVEPGSGTNSAVLKNSGAVATGSFAVSLGTDNMTGSTPGTGDVLAYSTAVGYGAFAEGAAYAEGDYSHAEGGGNSVRTGYPTVPTAHGKYSHAEGTHTYAGGVHSHVEGSMTKTTNRGAHAEGRETHAKGGYSHAEGVSTLADVPGSHAEGGYIDGDDNITAGGQAYGNASHAEGVNTVTTGEASHAEGRRVTSTAGGSHAEGNSTIVLDRTTNDTPGKITAAFESSRNFTAAIGTGAHAEGWNTFSGGNATHSEGRETESKGDYSHAEGYVTKALNSYEHAQGKFNISNNGGTPETTTIHSIGIGILATPENAVEVMLNGDVYIKGVGNYDGKNIGTTDVEHLAAVLDDMPLASELSVTPLDETRATVQLKTGTSFTAVTSHQSLAGYQTALTFDNEPTSGSNNPVRSGGVYSALDAKLGPYPFVTPAFSLGEWTFSWPEGSQSTLGFTSSYSDGTWTFSNDDNNNPPITVSGYENSKSLTFTAWDVGGNERTVTATRSNYICILSPFANNQVEMGRWVILRNGVDVTSQVSQPGYDSDEGAWNIFDATLLDEQSATLAVGGIDAIHLSWIPTTGSNVHYTATRSPSAFTVSVANAPAAQQDGMRDLYFVLEVPQDESALAVTWDSTIDRFPGGDSANAAPAAGSTNVYHIFEYESGHFAVEKYGSVVSQIFDVAGTIDFSNFPAVSVSVDKSLDDALSAANAGKRISCKLYFSQDAYIIGWGEIVVESGTGNAVEIDFGLNLDSNMLNADGQFHPYMLRLGWYYENGDEAWSISPYELATTDALTEFLPLSGGTMEGDLTMASGEFVEILGTGSAKSILKPDGVQLTNSLDETHTLSYPALAADTTFATTDALTAKLDSATMAPAFAAASSYLYGDYVTREGRLYRCSSVTGAPSGSWDSSKWAYVDMTSPDATLDITSDGALRVVAANGDTLWRQGYTLAVSSSSSLANEWVNYYEFPQDSTDNVVLSLPSVPAGKVGDLILDVRCHALPSAFLTSENYVVGNRVTYNSAVYTCSADVASGSAWSGETNWALTYPAFSTTSTYLSGEHVTYDSRLWMCKADVSAAGAWTGTVNWRTASFTLSSALGNSVSVVVPEGENISDTLTMGPGEFSELYFTMTAFRIDDKPTWKVVRQNVENGGAD